LIHPKKTPKKKRIETIECPPKYKCPNEDGSTFSTPTNFAKIFFARVKCKSL
jgi:hypothetical protein